MYFNVNIVDKCLNEWMYINNARVLKWRYVNGSDVSVSSCLWFYNVFVSGIKIVLIDRCVLCLLSILCLWVNLIIVWNTVTIFSKQIKFVTIHENIYGSRAWLIFRSTKIHRHRYRTFWIYQHVGNRNKKFGMHQFGNNYTTTKGKKNGKIRFHKTH